MGEPPNKPARPRRLLVRALKAAHEAGAKVRSATVEQGRVTLTFAGESAVDDANENEWDRKLAELERGKH